MNFRGKNKVQPAVKMLATPRLGRDIRTVVMLTFRCVERATTNEALLDAA